MRFDRNNWQCFALLAAFFNALIGVFSKNIFSLGMLPSHVAFFKCLLAFLLITLIHIFDKNGLQKIIQHAKAWWKIAICAFFGIFVLCFFETIAYSYSMVSTVVFLLLGASSITTFLMSYFFLNERITFINLFSFLLCVIGLFYIFNEKSVQLASFGSVLAMIAGIGYGLFLSFTKKLDVSTNGLAFLWWFIGFGMFYLSVPFILNHPSFPPLSSLPTLLLLSIVPTIGGYFCVARALAFGDASKVQIFALTEPLFASLMGFVCFGELLKGTQLFGAVLILLSIYLAIQYSFSNSMLEKN
ncbi:MAG: DMT family transporter [Gammaproteobacteria bacterium]|nr:DMT family transporter [Gammaproteobacteria bacterium]